MREAPELWGLEPFSSRTTSYAFWRYPMKYKHLYFSFHLPTFPGTCFHFWATLQLLFTLIKIKSYIYQGWFWGGFRVVFAPMGVALGWAGWLCQSGSFQSHPHLYPRHYRLKHAKGGGVAGVALCCVVHKTSGRFNNHGIGKIIEKIKLTRKGNLRKVPQYTTKLIEIID